MYSDDNREIFSLALISLIFGLAMNVSGILYFNSRVNKSEDWGPVAPVSWVEILLFSSPFLIMGIPLIFKNRRALLTVLIFGFLSLMFAVHIFGVTDLQHGDEKQLGAWLAQIIMSLLCLLMGTLFALSEK